MSIWYVTEERVMRSVESTHTAKAKALIRNCIAAGSQAVEGLLHRRFYPERRTVRIDYPNYQYAPAWQLWLESNEIISVESLTSGGVTIAANDQMLRRSDDLREPPYDQIQMDLSSAAVLQAGATWQEAIEILGIFGGDRDTDTSYVDGALSGTVNTLMQTLTLVPSSGTLEVGVGSLIMMESERMIVRDRRMTDTGVNTSAGLNDLQSDRTLAVTNGSLFAIGETILVNAERMEITDIAGNNLIVDRATDGTALADHSSGVDVYALRTCIVERGALGSTAASHTDATFSTHRYPPLVEELAEAETLVLIEQKRASYARVIGSGANAKESGGQGLNDVRQLAKAKHGRECVRAEAI